MSGYLYGFKVSNNTNNTQTIANNVTNPIINTDNNTNTNWTGSITGLVNVFNTNLTASVQFSSQYGVEKVMLKFLFDNKNVKVRNTT